MNIVSTSGSKQPKIDLNALIERKAELKQQIGEQKQHIVTSTQHLLSPAAFSTYAFKAFSKGLSMVDGVMIGYKIMRTVRGFFKR